MKRKQNMMPEETLPVQAEPVCTAEQEGRRPWHERTSAKVAAFFLVIVMAVLAAASIFGAAAMIDQKIYVTPEQGYRDQAYRNLAEGIAGDVMTSLVSNRMPELEKRLAYQNVAGIQVRQNHDIVLEWGTVTDWQYESQWQIQPNGDVVNMTHSAHVIMLQPPNWIVTVSLPRSFTCQDQFYMVGRIITVMYAMRYAVYILALLSLTVGAAAFVFLMRRAGHRQGADQIQGNWLTKVPADLLFGVEVLAGFLLYRVLYEMIYRVGSGLIVLGIVVIPLAAGLVVAACMDAAVRLKLGGWWRHTICYWLGGKLLRRGKKLGAVLGGLFRGLPMIWKTALMVFAAAAVELLFTVTNLYEGYSILVFTVFKLLILIPAVLYAALLLHRLQKGGEAIASGDLSYQIDTSRMVLDFKTHGENLNHIGEGMAAAVEQRLKSERMKTELITNVSHDIKTPLTSIINYSDLIGKEPCDNEKITEYAEVLHRQSERLKRLIEDLVEASKASTGNLEVLLTPCEAGVLLNQAAGEYEQRLRQCQLELITKQPEAPVRIMADGRRMWRIFDNLLNNICKYSQAGTRVYITVEKMEGSAVITFKNTSRDALNISAEELMERFVRGDSARKSEGNGLGLSIAKSLTELQNGTLALMVDGDLFKTVLTFPTIEE